MKKCLTILANFFKCIGKGIVKIPFIARVAIGLTIGVLLALVAPKATFIGELGSLFTTALKAIAPILVFILIRTLYLKRAKT